MNTTESAPLSPTDTSKKDRRDLWASITVFALTASIVVYAYAADLVRQLADAVVSVRVDFDAPPVPTVTTPTGIEMQAGSSTVLDVPTADLSPVSVGFLRSAEALQSLGYLILLALLTWMVVRFMRGHLFDDGAIRLVSFASIAAVATIIVPQIPRTLGTNMLLRDVGAHDTLDFAPLGPEFWYSYVFCMALSAVAVALRIGNRMARDSEGLV